MVHPRSGAAAPDASHRSRLLTADKVRGWEVFSDAGQLLGTASDLVFDLRGGRVQYLVLSSAGFLGVGEKRRLLAWESVNIAADGGRRFICNAAHGKAPHRAADAAATETPAVEPAFNLRAHF